MDQTQNESVYGKLNVVQHNIMNQHFDLSGDETTCYQKVSHITHRQVQRQANGSQ